MSGQLLEEFSVSVRTSSKIARVSVLVPVRKMELIGQMEDDTRSTRVSTLYDRAGVTKAREDPEAIFSLVVDKKKPKRSAVSVKPSEASSRSYWI